MDTLPQKQHLNDHSTATATSAAQSSPTSGTKTAKSKRSKKVKGSGSKTSPRNYETTIQMPSNNSQNTKDSLPSSASNSTNQPTSATASASTTTTTTNTATSATAAGAPSCPSAFGSGSFSTSDPLQPRLSRQDSISFFTSLGNPNSNSISGGRFSTDSNSSISNFLNLPLPGNDGSNTGSGTGTGSSFAFDTNGRGMSLINNLFMPPTSSSSSSTTNASSNNNQNSSSYPANDYASTYTTFRRPSEQLEPFNASVKLKNPSFSRPSTNSSGSRDLGKFSFGSGSFALPPGTSFSDAVSNPNSGVGAGNNNGTNTTATSGNGTSQDFDFFSNKRDSSTFRFGSQSRQPSFLNSDGFDFFRKDSDVGPGGNFTGFETVHENNSEALDEEMGAERTTETSGRKRRASRKKSSAAESSGSASKKLHLGGIQNEEQDFRQPVLPAYADYQKQSLPQTSQQQQQQQQHSPWDSNQAPSPTSSDASARFRRNALLPPNQQAHTSPSYVVDQPVSPSSQTSTIVPPLQQQHQQPQVPPVSQLPLPQQQQPNQPIVHQRPGTPPPQQQLGTAQPGASQLNTPEPIREGGRPLLGATKVDQLMLVIQARKKGIHDQIPQASDGTILENGQGILPPPTELVGGIDKPKSKATKNHECPYCHKTFTQSTHLEVHIRSHIGYKPFECNYCGKRFTQGGNLRTHLRLHTGEKPYTCEICDRSFSRKGNLAAHKLTHENLKPYECKLDSCGKAFTQLGNLKAHQNRFHLETLNRLTSRLAEIDPNSQDIGAEERELLNYFAELYKNSNRGIKGRGKRTEGIVQSQHQTQAEQLVPGTVQNVGSGNSGHQFDAGKNISFKDVDYKS